MEADKDIMVDRMTLLLDDIINNTENGLIYHGKKKFIDKMVDVAFSTTIAPEDHNYFLKIINFMAGIT